MGFFKIDDRKIREEHGSVNNFLASVKVGIGVYSQFRNKKCDYFKTNQSQSFKFKELLKERGYLINQDDGRVR
jgi:hypothetical protein